MSGFAPGGHQPGIDLRDARLMFQPPRWVFLGVEFFNCLALLLNPGEILEIVMPKVAADNKLIRKSKAASSGQ